MKSFKIWLISVCLTETVENFWVHELTKIVTQRAMERAILGVSLSDKILGLRIGHCSSPIILCNV